MERGQGSRAFKTVDCTGTKVQEVNQVKLGATTIKGDALYIVDRGKSMYSKRAGVGVHQYYKKRKCRRRKRAWQPKRVSWSDKVSKSGNLHHSIKKWKAGRQV